MIIMGKEYFGVTLVSFVILVLSLINVSALPDTTTPNSDFASNNEYNQSVTGNSVSLDNLLAKSDNKEKYFILWITVFFVLIFLLVLLFFKLKNN